LSSWQSRAIEKAAEGSIDIGNTEDTPFRQESGR
jgi:hypothetical protein